MMHKISKSLLVAATLACCCSVQASLIGDTITVAHHNPDLGQVSFTQNVVVQAGPADFLLWGGGTAFGLDPEASSITLSFLPSSGGITLIGDTFAGLVVTGINDTIIGFSVSTNLVGWSDSRFNFDAHSFSANLQLLNFNAGDFITINLVTASATVPDTGDALGLALVGFLGMLSISRRLSRRAA